MLEFCCPGKQGSLLNCLGPDWKPVVSLGMPTQEPVGRAESPREVRRRSPLQGPPDITDAPHLCGEQEWDLREG